MNSTCDQCGRTFKNPAGLNRHKSSKACTGAKDTESRLDSTATPVVVPQAASGPTASNPKIPAKKMGRPKGSRGAKAVTAGLGKPVGPITPGMYDNIANAVGDNPGIPDTIHNGGNGGNGGNDGSDSSDNSDSEESPSTNPAKSQYPQSQYPYYQQYQQQYQRAQQAKQQYQQSQQEPPQRTQPPQNSQQSQQNQLPPFPSINIAETIGLPTEAKLLWALSKIQQLSDEVVRLRTTTNNTINIKFENADRSSVYNYPSQIVQLTQLLDVQWEAIIEPLMSKIKETDVNIDDLAINIVNNDTKEVVASLSGMWLTQKASVIIPIMHNLRRAITQEALLQYNNAVRELTVERMREEMLREQQFRKNQLTDGSASSNETVETKPTETKSSTNNSETIDA
jgi:hypothetical protein